MNSKYRKPQKVAKAGIGPNDGGNTDAWWYGEEKKLLVYIDGNDGRGCHWAHIPRRSIEAWLKATAQAKLAP